MRLYKKVNGLYVKQVTALDRGNLVADEKPTKKETKLISRRTQDERARKDYIEL